MVRLPLITDISVSGKNVLVRGDLDVPMTSVNGTMVIEDTSRLEALTPTLNFLRRGEARRITIGGHVGRPSRISNFEFRISNEKLDNDLSTRPIEEWFRKNGYIREEDVVLENLRFFEGEEKNGPEFAKGLSDGQDLYINDAFAVCHREAASTCSVTKLLPSFAGLRFVEEVENLSKTTDNPKRPLVIIVGGAKLETKLPLVIKMYEMADFVLVGGLLSAETKTLLTLQHSKLDAQKAVLLVAELTVDTKDITEESAENFRQVILEGGTVVWNGPMGYFEGGFDRGTELVAEAVSLSRGYRVIGGGDTISAVAKYNLTGNYDFVSMGGGAMLTFLAGGEMPGIEALLKSRAPSTNNQ
jgi:phosphoglycerate kinase